MNNKEIQMSEVVDSTVVGVDLKCVTFEEFLKLIPSESATQTILQYNRQVSYGEISCSLDIDSEDSSNDSVYMRSAVIVQEPTKNNLLTQVLDQVAFGSFTGTEQERTEAAVMASIENFGCPTHLVKLTDHLLGLFSAEDFKYKHLGPAQGAVMVYRTAPNIVFRAMD